jgi:hypothetical protein
MRTKRQDKNLCGQSSEWKDRLNEGGIVRSNEYLSCSRMHPRLPRHGAPDAEARVAACLCPCPRRSGCVLLAANQPPSGTGFGGKSMSHAKDMPWGVSMSQDGPTEPEIKQFFKNISEDLSYYGRRSVVRKVAKALERGLLERFPDLAWNDGYCTCCVVFEVPSVLLARSLNGGEALKGKP